MRRHTPTALMIATTLALTACSPATEPGTQPAPVDATGSASEDAPTATTYPITIDNCGTPVTFDSAPQRIVTIKSATTELLLALGAGNSITAIAYPDGPAPEPFTDQAAALPVLAERVPSQEVVLEQNPDLIYAGWESNFSADGVGERPALQKLGVHTFVAPSACKEDNYRPNPLTFDNVFAEIEQVGEILDAQPAAAELVAAQRDIVKQITPDPRGLSALWFSSGSDIPYVGGNTGAPALIMDTAGLTNIASDIDDAWGPFGWEQVAAADPDVIVLVDSEWNSADKKIGILEDGPLTSQLTAVKNKAYVIVPFPATEAGVRTASAAADVAKQVDAIAN